MSKKSNGSSGESLSLRSRRAAASLYNLEMLFQKHFHGTVEVQTIMYFLFIASKDEPVDVTSVATALGLTKASASRNYYRLSEGLRGTEGLGLIHALPDMMDNRRKLLQLTPKGREVAEEITSYMLSSCERVSNVA
jgi:DNA-binding MarR family transcriptional regulator